jgi:signal transduction histidine kinase/integral membrane sensor domain MASE1
MPPRLVRWFQSSAGVITLTATACLLGAWLGWTLRFPPETTSVLWPPNAILASALLLAPSSRWWPCLSGALIAHVAIQLALALPADLSAALFLTNTSEALITAGGIRAFVSGPLRFTALRDVGVFITFAALVSPILSSFADAAVVHLIQGEPYWLVWRTRVFANSLSELIVIPIALCTATFITGGSMRWPARVTVEGLLLGAVLLGTSVLVLGPSVVEINIPGVPRTPTVFLLPTFIWAAVRFGAPGISTALLIAALVGSFSAIAGNRPFAVLEPGDSLVALQLYLILMAIPLFAVSALFEERRSTAAELAQRLLREETLGRIAVAFVGIRPGEFLARVSYCMQQIGHCFDVDRVVMMRQSEQDQEIESVHRWLRPGTSLPDLGCSAREFPFALGLVARGHAVICRNLHDLPVDALQDRESLTRLGLGSALIAPFVIDGPRQGALSLSTAAPREWRDDEAAQARLFGEVLGNAVARHHTEEALLASEGMKSASLVAVVDREGCIIAVNDQWLQVAGPDHGQAPRVGVGVNYLEVCRRAALSGAETRVMLRGLEEVLAGRRRSFVCEYSCPVGDAVAWYAMSVVPLRSADGGAVISHVDVTERRMAELDSQQARQELGHFARVTTMGELSASLAHQLNQPLAGILTNAQAAQRYLDASEPDLAELRAIVTDIIEDDRRASGVIHRMRELMTKNGGPPMAIDINTLIRDVTALLTSDSIIRNVSVDFDLAPGAPLVRGDRIDLQQVVLNLLINALEAVADRPVPQRMVQVRSALSDGHIVIAVEDSGSGLPDGAEGRIFEAFYTTKPAGMGMGLAIARSLVESYGGRIWAERRPGAGATFLVRLPLLKEHPA